MQAGLFARDNPNLFHFMAGPRVNTDAAFPSLEKAMADTLGKFMQPFLDAGLKPEIARIRTALFVSALQGVTTQILHRRMRVTRTKAKSFIAETCRRLFEGFR